MFIPKLAILFLIIFSLKSLASSSKAIISVDNQALGIIKNQVELVQLPQKDDSPIKLIEVKESDIPRISHLLHEELNRCGGFVYHDKINEAEKFLQGKPLKKFLYKYEINRESLVENLLEKVEEDNLIATIEKLSSFQNRYFRSKSGVQSQRWIKNHWSELANRRNDITVEEFSHKFEQPSIILTIKGKTSPDEYLILGGHGDSISSWFPDRKTNKAPGADDNASGIAVITEIINVLLKNNYHPNKTFKFISYAAEEVGLKGSKEIAESMANETILGVLQFDMTNYKGTQTDINLISDYTDQEQNQFLAELIDRYVKVTWGYSKCGYACSDHASWTMKGFKASFPYESQMNNNNPKIHTEKDTLDNLGNNAKHAMNFTKLGLSFLIEMDKKN